MKFKLFEEKDKLKGGRADNKKSSKYDSEELEMGTKVEMEHTNDEELAKEIAKDHLEEIPDYYTRLKKMEEDAKEYWENKDESDEDDKDDKDDKDESDDEAADESLNESMIPPLDKITIAKILLAQFALSIKNQEPFKQQKNNIKTLESWCSKNNINKKELYKTFGDFVMQKGFTKSNMLKAEQFLNQFPPDSLLLVDEITS